MGRQVWFRQAQPDQFWGERVGVDGFWQMNGATRLAHKASRGSSGARRCGSVCRLEAGLRRLLQENVKL